MFCRNTERCSAKILVRCPQKYWELICRITERCFVEMRVFLQKHWEGFCRNTEKCSAEILTRYSAQEIATKVLKCFLQIYWREFNILTHNEQSRSLLKTSETWSVCYYIMIFSFRSPNGNKRLLRAKSFLIYF